jgi:hypothetical protein
MRAIYWLISLLCVAGLWFSQNLHVWLLQNLAIYRLSSPSLLQATLGIIAGLAATKAADSSRELRRLMSVAEIETLLKKADSARSEKDREEERRRNIVSLVKHETQQQYARDMLTLHREQLMEHWRAVQQLQAMLDEPPPELDLDPKVKRHIQEFIVRTKYIDYMGRDFLRQIPFLGGFLHYLLGPLWESYYMANIAKVNRLFLKKIQRFGDEQAVNPGPEAGA